MIFKVIWVYLQTIRKSLVSQIFSLQSTLDNIYKLLKSRKLDLNPTKCKFLTIKKNKSFETTDVFINITKIPTFKVFKNLGINISENLKWNEHINYLYYVAQVSSYQLSKIYFKTNSATIQTKLFKICVRPKLEYNTQTWSPF